MLVWNVLVFPFSSIVSHRLYNDTRTWSSEKRLVFKWKHRLFIQYEDTGYEIISPYARVAIRDSLECDDIRDVALGNELPKTVSRCLFEDWLKREIDS